MTFLTRVYLAFIISLGLISLVFTAVRWESENLPRFATFALLACFGGVLKIHLPGITATLSGAFLIVLLAIALLSAPEAIAVGFISAAVQYSWHSRAKLRFVQGAFNVSDVGIAALLASGVMHSEVLAASGFE